MASEESEGGLYRPDIRSRNGWAYLHTPYFVSPGGR